jgi:hypothetical protein
MPHDSALIAETRAWLSKAAKDLAAAEYESRATPPFAEDIAFHAQQAAEKGSEGVPHLARPALPKNTQPRRTGLRMRSN